MPVLRTEVDRCLGRCDFDLSSGKVKPCPNDFVQRNWFGPPPLTPTRGERSVTRDLVVDHTVMAM